jgi:UDP-2,4-diacetamido-2,4,6-trideoxy-beta-L-altropyranose hydrolase
MSAVPLVIRADASTQIGSGHVMRCLALAQVWQEQVVETAAFVTAVPEMLRMRLEAEGMTVYAHSGEAGDEADAQQVIALAQQLKTRYVVVDGYQFGADYQQWLKDAGLRLLALDDNGEAQHYSADLVLNQNIHASEALYTNRQPYTRLLLGTRYTLLRREFWSWRGWQRDIPDAARKVLVTMGGSDPDNVTLKVLRALEQVQLNDLHVKVVVGGSSPHYDALQMAARQSPHHIELAHNVSDMPALMAWADVAVSAGGSTCWELAFMGLLGMVIVLAENQQPLADRLAQQDAVITLGRHADLTPETIAARLTDLVTDADRRRVMSARGRELVDSYGGERVVKALRQSSLNMRLVGPQDRELLWQWANDPLVRKSAFNTAPITWDDHMRWFARKQADPGCHHFIAIDQDGHAVGQIRFDHVVANEPEFEVDVSIGSEWRGYGYGAQIIGLGVEALCQLTAVRAVHALVRVENIASRRAFEKAGFMLLQPSFVKGDSIKHLIWRQVNE